MDFGLSDEQRMILDTVREFVRRELSPLLPEVQRAEIQGERFPDPATARALHERAKAAGLWGLLTPEEYGGADLGMLMTSMITMETARSLVNFNYGGSADNILYGGSEDQKREYLVPTINGERRSCFALSEPDTGSDATNIQARATRNGGDWVINGRKTWISGAHDADYAIVFAVTDQELGARGGITAFLVDREMGWTEQPIPLMSSWEASDMFFDDVRVPDRNVLGEVGNGFGLAMKWIGQGRVVIPSRAVGQAQGLLQLGLDYIRSRRAFGQPIASYQAIQWMVADSAVEIDEVKWATLHAAWMVDQGMDARHYASIAKVSGANMVWQVADRVLQMHGGMGYTRELPVERILREVRVYRIFEGTDEIQRRSIARNLLNDYVHVSDW
ncbi:MAG: acyl-CoA/acyl-ACP dehydrogenase [Candidatus Dormibacteraeota bacterium]|nr:acyl-CoA/acyl-ACP dehydrogenase [Candidatus Dormibacteraeota bacterium]